MSKHTPWKLRRSPSTQPMELWNFQRGRVAEFTSGGDELAEEILAKLNAFHSENGREIKAEKITEGLVWEMRDLLYWAERAIAPFSKDPAEKSGIARIRALLAKLED